MKSGARARWKLAMACVVLCTANCLAACWAIPTRTYPKPPTTLPELIAVLQDDDDAARLTAAWALKDMGPQAEPAVPALIENLHFYHSDVREAVAYALGEIGPGAKPAVPELIDVLQNDDVLTVRRAAAYALGQIGDASAIPALANVLYEKVIRRESCQELVTRYPDDCVMDRLGCNCGGETGRIMGRTDDGVLDSAAIAIARIRRYAESCVKSPKPRLRKRILHNNSDTAPDYRRGLTG
jgi:hypothetical protein